MNTKLIRKTIGLLNSMIDGGEKHSYDSSQMVRMSLDEISKVEKLNLANVMQQSELFVSFARFVANYKHSYSVSYETMFKEWVQKETNCA